MKTTQVERVDEKIISELAQYHTICQNTKEEIKNQISLRDREIAKRKQLDVATKRSENEIILSNMQFLKIMKEISMISEQFETQKVADFKDCLKNFVLIQLKYHASCLEIYSNLYQDVSFVDEAKDAEVGR